MKTLTILSIVLALTGCATPATSDTTYTKPKTYNVRNQEIIDESFDVIWDKLVKNLSSDFFVINNIEKNSRIINLSFSSNRPSDYVDCGNTVRNFSSVRGGIMGAGTDSIYSYNPADSANYTFTSDGWPYNVTRTSRLDGIINIYLAPEGTKTIVSVNTSYIVDVKINYNSNHFNNDSFKFNFSTKLNYESAGADGVTCTARGNIEQRIISYAKI